VGISLAQQIAFDRVKSDFIIITGDDIEPVSPNVLDRFAELQALGQDFCIGAGVNISKGYYPVILGSHKTSFGEIELTGHVSGMMMMSRKAAANLLHIERDIHRYARWRLMGGKVGYAKWIETFHFDSGVAKRGYEYIF